MSADELPITTDTVAAAERLTGLSFTAAEREQMLGMLGKARERYAKIRQVPLANHMPPALGFQPLVSDDDESDVGVVAEVELPEVTASPPTEDRELAFATVVELASWLRRGELTSVRLTELCLERLGDIGARLECVVTLTEERALAQARRADQELAAGRWRGPLHGVPWGAKDLLSTRGIPTTWGAVPFRDQIIDEDATVVERLDAAGAVLVAKLSMGALAWDQVWFGGETRSPWNPEEGSGGSSAGSGAATGAGLVPFAIGTETWGSILSPATRCGVSGLRPTFGRVSRHGAMALAWSMDKIGPMARSATDCALVFASIHGADGMDASAVDAPFVLPATVDLSELRIGYAAMDFEMERAGRKQDADVLGVLRELGADPQPFEFPDEYAVEALDLIIHVEAAAAFDELTRSGRDDLLVRQGEHAWPNYFRQARLIPAVEYVQANRVRAQLMVELEARMQEFDVVVCPTLAGHGLLLTNLTGHPAVVVPNGFDENKGLPTSITFLGGLFDDAAPLAVAAAYQGVTDFHRRVPPVA